MEAVALIFKYNQEEYVKAVRWHLFACRTITKRDLHVLAVGFSLSALYQIFISFSLASALIFVSLALPAIPIGMMYFYLPVNTYKRTAELQEEHTYVFTINGITVEASGTQTEIEWETYRDLWESDEFYFLMKTVRKFTIIPKRAFGSTEEKEWFEKFAMINMGMSRRLQ